MQAPDATFKIPIVSDQITILAVSERTPTYWDFCFADESCNACCWLARNTFPGITHSGDILDGLRLLDFVRINENSLTEKEICVFISGFQITQITRFVGTHPALMVADHVDKVCPRDLLLAEIKLRQNNRFFTSSQSRWTQRQ